MAQIHMTYWNNKIPEFRPRLECQICPLYTDERRKKWISDLQRVCEFKTRKQSYRCLTAIDYAAFTFMVTDAYKLEMLCKILGYFQIVDDHSDDRNTITQRNHEKVVELWKESQMVLKKLLNPGFNEKIFLSLCTSGDHSIHNSMPFAKILWLISIVSKGEDLFHVWIFIFKEISKKISMLLVTIKIISIWKN